MSSRGQVTELINQMEAELKEMEFAYDQYFLGLEKRAPEQKRLAFTKRMRKMVSLYIPQTDLRFRLRGLTSRFNSYAGYWDRIQRLIDEGKYERHTSRMKRIASSKPAESPSPAANDSMTDLVEDLFRELVKAHHACQMRPPNRDQVAIFLARQQESIRQRFGNQHVEFVVVTEEGKPKIKVRSRR